MARSGTTRVSDKCTSSTPFGVCHLTVRTPFCLAVTDESSARFTLVSHLSVLLTQSLKGVMWEVHPLSSISRSACLRVVAFKARATDERPPLLFLLFLFNPLFGLFPPATSSATSDGRFNFLFGFRGLRKHVVVSWLDL